MTTTDLKVFEIESDTSELEPLRDKIKTFLEKSGFSDKTLQSLLVALGEASTNAIRHSYKNEKGHKVRVTLEDLPDKVVMKVRDWGQKIDVKGIKEPVLPPVKGGGLGIYFMKTIMDEFGYNTTHATGNELVMVKLKGKEEDHENSSQKK